MESSGVGGVGGGVGLQVNIFSLACLELFFCQLVGRKRHALISVMLGGFEPA